MSVTQKKPTSSDEKLLHGLRKFLAEGSWREQVVEKVFNRLWFDHLELLEAQRLSPSTGRLLWRYPVQPEYANQFGILAGGMQTTAHEYCTAWTLLTIGTKLGMSSSVNLTYYKAARVGDVLLLETEIIDSGKRRATCRGTLRREKDGMLVSTSEHHMEWMEKAML